MRSDTLAHDARRLGHASAADSDAYARAEHVLRCYGIGYVCQHPELLFGRLPAAAPGNRIDPTHRQAPYDSSSIYTRPGSGHHDTGNDDLLMRIVAGYQMLDEIYSPYRAPARAEKPSNEGDTSTSTNIGDQR